MNFIKFVYILLGTLSLILGIIGIFLPGLPTTPFLLLTAALYMKGSEKLYNKLITNKYIGSYIVNYQKNKGLSKNQKIKSIVFVWITMAISLFFSKFTGAKIYILLGAGLIGTCVILFWVPTYVEKKNNEKQ